MKGTIVTIENSMAVLLMTSFYNKLGTVQGISRIPVAWSLECLLSCRKEIVITQLFIALTIL